MRPDPYSGSYDFTNPQSFNRYTFVMNNPMSANDPLGLDMNDCWDPWWRGGGGAGGGWGDGGGCDPLFSDCGGSEGSGGDVGVGSTPAPLKFVDLDPNHTMTEHLGLPPGMMLPSGDLLSIFGVSTQCEFAACGPGVSPFAPGASSVALGGAATIGCVLLEPCGAVEGI